MIDDFKCGVCQHDKAHTPGRGTDKLIDIMNPQIDSRVILKACEKCHVVHAFWEKYTEAEDIPKEKRDAVANVLKEQDDNISPDVERGKYAVPSQPGE